MPAKPGNPPAPEVLHGADRFAPDAALGASQAATPRASARQPQAAAGSALLLLQSTSSTVVIALFVITFILQAFEIPSPSMEKTLLIGDYLLVDKVHYGEAGLAGHLLPYSEVRRGDIIVFHYPVNPAQHFVKRVIGLPGDRVHMLNKRVWVNGKPLNDVDYAQHSPGSNEEFRDNFPRHEDYVPGQIDAQWWLELQRSIRGGDVVVPPGSYFVMGDNRDNSDDSRYWGFVPSGNVVGRPLLIYFSIASLTPQQATDASDGKLTSLAMMVESEWQAVRWNRVMRLVH